MSAVPEVAAFVEFLAKERNDSPHTVKAYGRDLADFVAFCGRYYGGRWSWAGVDRQAVRAWLGAQQQRGLARRSAARALSALRTFYRFLNATRGVEANPAKAARTPKLGRKLPVYLDRVEIDLLFHEAERRADGPTTSMCTPCVTRSLRICWTPAPICGPSRSCWATPRSAPRKCILIRRWSG